MWCTHADTTINRRFEPQKKGYLGADSAASIPLNTTHTLWLWGDTLWGTYIPPTSDGHAHETTSTLSPQVTLPNRRHTSGRRQIAHFVHNTVALLRNDQHSTPVFFARNPSTRCADASAAPPRSAVSTSPGYLRPTYAAEDPCAYYWLINGARLPSGRLLVLAATVDSRFATLHQLGTDAVLLKPSAAVAPDAWAYETARLPGTSPRISLNTAVLLHTDGYVYLVGGRAQSDYGPVGAQILARAPIASVDIEGGAGFRELQYWGGAQVGWQPKASVAAELFAGRFTEGSLVQMDGDFHFVGLQAFDRSVSIFSASSLTGPWSDARVLYTLPPLPANATLAYGAKAHAELSRSAGELVVSYNTNGALSSLSSSLGVYHPLFFRATRC